MKSNRIAWGVVSLVVLVTIAITLAPPDSHSQHKPQPTPADSGSKGRDTFPIVEYFNSYESARQKRRSEKYSNGLAILSLDSDIPKDLETVLSIDPVKGLPALPVGESEIVVLGKIVDASAHLSSNKRSIFSEFKIEIETVYKNKLKLKPEDGRYLTLEREGGIVRYPSGNKFWYLIPGQQMPLPNRRYILFLTNDFPIYGRQKEDLYLLSGYELKEGRVFPLDKPIDSQIGDSIYKGTDETVLLNDLDKILKNR